MKQLKYKEEIILIVDSILDDYYFLWECYQDFIIYGKPSDNPLNTFTEALKEAYENKYIDFYKGLHFNGDEELIPEFQLTNSVIEELLDYKIETMIRVTTSILGVAFFEQRHYL